MAELETKAAAIVLQTAYKNRAKIFDALMDGLRRVVDGKVTVAIFGIGGSGKSTTRTLMTEGAEQAGKNVSYYPTVLVSKQSIKSRPFVSVWDTPGQEDFRDAAWDDAMEAIKKSKRAIIINVVSYGYSAPGQFPFSEIERQSPKKTKAETIRNYFRLERKKK